MVSPCVIVHGGAFNIPESYVKRYREGTQQAAKAGYECLIQNGSALDAVEKAVNALENNSAFNAGHGAVLTEEGTVEMDAIVVDGDSGKTGAVTCVRDIANPVSLARKVMEKTPHCLLAANGAMKFAESINFPIIKDKTELITTDSVCKSFKIGGGTFNAHIQTYMNKIVEAEDVGDLKEAFEKIVKDNKFTDNGHDTVGAVAIDKEGRIACATSTGGMPGKMIGRVGDSPIFGCGAYANKIGGCSSTGHGESLIRATVCREAVYYLEKGYSAMEASKKAIEYTLEKTDGRGGIILIDKKGEIGYFFSTRRMAWASVSQEGMKHGLNENEELFEKNN